MLGFHRLGQAGQHLQRRDTLSRGRDVVLLTLDGHDRHTLDGAQIDLLARHHEFVLGNLAVLEDPLDGGQVEFGRHVHHGQVFVIEPIVRVVICRLTAHHAHDLFLEGLGVTLAIHRDEACELQEARINQTPGTLVLEANPLNCQLFQLPHRDAAAKVGDIGGGSVRVDRAADQRQAAGLGCGVLCRQIGRGGQGQRCGLADRDHVRFRSQMPHEINEIQRVILDVELAGADRNVARIVPVGHINVGVGQQAGDRGPQQRRVVARHRCHDQQFARHRRAAANGKVDQVAKAFFDHGHDVDQMILTRRPHHRADAPVRLGHHAAEAAFRHFAPGGGQIDHWIHRHCEDWIRCHRPCGGARPLTGIAEAFHPVVCGHILHVTSLRWFASRPVGRELRGTENAAWQRE